MFYYQNFWNFKAVVRKHNKEQAESSEFSYRLSLLQTNIHLNLSKDSVTLCVFQGTLESGTVFDTSKQPNRGPLPFKLGAGKVIPGKPQQLSCTFIKPIQAVMPPEFQQWGPMCAWFSGQQHKIRKPQSRALEASMIYHIFFLNHTALRVVKFITYRSG